VHEGLQVRAIRWLAHRLGVDAVLPLVRGMELRAAGSYAGQADAADLVPEERGHARALAALTEGAAGATPDSLEDVTSSILSRERWHRHDRGGSLRAAVFGVNDGLVSNLSLVIGVAGANPEPRFILLAGVAGLLAGSFSMAAGEYVSMSAQREMYERQIALEREELALDPEQEHEELSLLYQAKGIPAAQAEQMAARVMAQPGAALDTMAREELGLDPESLGSPWGAAASSLVAFAAGAILPVLPYIFASGTIAFVLSAVLSALGLFGVGAAITLFTGRSPALGAVRMLTIGAFAATITFIVGRLIGVGVTG
ncbi:MAG: VIT1/CCC1 transporter family protein, partial [Dehalococcoidia bacterium]